MCPINTFKKKITTLLKLKMYVLIDLCTHLSMLFDFWPTNTPLVGNRKQT